MKFVHFDQHMIPYKTEIKPRILAIEHELKSFVIDRESRMQLLTWELEALSTLRKQMLNNKEQGSYENLRRKRTENYARQFMMKRLSQQSVTTQLAALGGQLRNKKVQLCYSDGKRDANFPEPQAIQQLLLDFESWWNDSEPKSNLAKGICLHAILLSIHPLMESNGSMSRATEWGFHIRNLGLAVPYVELIHFLYANEYDQILLSCRQDLNWTRLVDFLSEKYLEHAKRNFEKSRLSFLTQATFRA